MSGDSLQSTKVSKKRQTKSMKFKARPAAQPRTERSEPAVEDVEDLLSTKVSKKCKTKFMNFNESMAMPKFKAMPAAQPRTERSEPAVEDVEDLLCNLEKLLPRKSKLQAKNQQLKAALTTEKKENNLDFKQRQSATLEKSQNNLDFSQKQSEQPINALEISNNNIKYAPALPRQPTNSYFRMNIQKLLNYRHALLEAQKAQQQHQWEQQQPPEKFEQKKVKAVSIDQILRLLLSFCLVFTIVYTLTHCQDNLF
ncbi:uncharacterized protein LOC108595493 [Drosophila busckii]|uniref:uncharacterized protein LOC108595493 n=1 Tax=Drosophila busckii TaxID=30019 RepID=UPI00083E9FBA|nr:uncharacterized protein LOC108595493 [Drosophila busckii]